MYMSFAWSLWTQSQNELEFPEQSWREIWHIPSNSRWGKRLVHSILISLKALSEGIALQGDQLNSELIDESIWSPEKNLYRLKKKKKKDILIWTSHLLYENSYVAYAISQIEYPVQVSTTSRINIVEPICYTCCLITRVLCTNKMRLLDPSTFERAQNYASLHPTLIPGQFVDR